MCNHKTKLLTVLILLLLSSAAFAGNFEDGVTAYQAGDFVKAHKFWLIEAEKGNASAQNNIGHMYRYSQGVSQDYKEAVKWYRMAAEQGYVTAQSNLGGMYYHGYGVLQSYEDAYAWWVVAAANGNEQARKNMEFAQAGEFTKSQIEQGQQIAKEIMARIGN